MNTFSSRRWLICTLCVAALSVADVADAQRVRFGSRDETTAASSHAPRHDGWVSVAQRYVSNSPTPTSSSSSASADEAGAEGAARSRMPAYSTMETPVYMGSPVYREPPPNSSSASAEASVATIPPAATYRVASATPISSPAASYGSSFAQPVLVAGVWDPYRIATRHAAFAGTVVSNPGLPGQFTLPQPMPRVPYYTQQPISTAGQPYVVIPEAGCAAPALTPGMPTQVMPLAAPGTVPTTAPAYVPPTVPTLGAPVMAAPPTVPTMAPPGAIPLATSKNCYFLADAIFFTRDAQIGNQPLVLLDLNAPTQSNVLLSTADLGFNFQPGPRVLLGTQFDGFRAIEASYFGIYNWNDSATINGDNNLNLPGDLGLAVPLDFFNADQMNISYKAQIHNGELNYLQYFGAASNIAWLVGFRYFNLGEKFSITSTDNQTGSSYYNISTYNNLFGGQLGARVKQACGNWSYDLTGKAGVYGNAIRSSQFIADFDNFVVRDTHASGGQVAFLGEIGLNGNYKFSECLSLRGGYQVYWIDGLSLAPNQLDFTDTPTSGTTLHKTGNMFMHGAHAGLMAQW
ncbi:MAG: BBP7 family outer membrane beta-barrel protein [Pirellulales bacterium]|nr:BBP7 family outer membrane beta-barrel protein [Pirellulales bacterium]